MGDLGTLEAARTTESKTGEVSAKHQLNKANVSTTDGVAPDPGSKDLSDDDYAVLSLRNFLSDICNQNGGGHGGSALGMAAIGVALYKYILRYNPNDAGWFDRDRFVLSNGKASRCCHRIACGIQTKLTSPRPCCYVLVCTQPSSRLR